MADTVREVWSIYKADLRLCAFFAFHRTKQFIIKNDKLFINKERDWGEAVHLTTASP